MTTAGATSSSNTKPVFLNVAACSYEGSLFGWSVTEDKKDLQLAMDLTFGFTSSTASLKCIAVSKSGKYLAVGGMDERVHVYNVSNNQSVGEISSHSGCITSLEFFEESYLMSCSEV